MWQVVLKNDMNDRILRAEGYNRVCVIYGGYFAIHETIRRYSKMEWLIDHDSATCEGMTMKRIRSSVSVLHVERSNGESKGSRF